MRELNETEIAEVAGGSLAFFRSLTKFLTDAIVADAGVQATHAAAKATAEALHQENRQQSDPFAPPGPKLPEVPGESDVPDVPFRRDNELWI